MPDEEQDALDALEKEASDFTKVYTRDTMVLFRQEPELTMTIGRRN